jgi:DNA-binding NarL/FixJ family response regulator
LSSKQIATEMTLSIHTVGHYRAEIMSKLNIHDIAGLTCYALQHGVARA